MGTVIELPVISVATFSTPGDELLTPHGSRGSPVLVFAGVGIALLGVPRELQFITGNGGPVTVTAMPQISNGSMVGQELVLEGGANPVTLIANGNLELNGNCTLGVSARLSLVWDGSIWGEVSRNDI